MKTIHLLLVVTLCLVRGATAQSQIGQDIDGEAAGDQSGRSVSLSADGSRVAVGGPLNDGRGTDAGHVRILDLSENGWRQFTRDINGEAAGDQSGYYGTSISADGSRVAIGAHLNDGNGPDSGHVRVYDISGPREIQLGQDIDGETPFDHSGYSLSLSADGNRVAIGAHQNDGNGGYSGHVRIYELSGNTWSQLGQDIDGNAAGDQSGRSVSLSADGNRVAIGAPGRGQGHVRIYRFTRIGWIQLGQDINGEALDDWSGYRVSLSGNGNRVAIGALYDRNGFDAGYVRVYQLSGNTWSRLGQDIDGEAGGDRSGSSVSLSADGNRVAIGAIYNDENGNNAGHVRIYMLTVNGWSQLGRDIDGEASGDWSGRSVSLSGDGRQVAVGAPFNDANGTDSGHVRVYSTQTQGDGDGDGWRDDVEAVFGSSSIDPDSVPEFKLHISSVGGGMVELMFPASSGANYTLQASSDLIRWSNIEEGISGSNDGVIRSFSTENPGRYFRVQRN